MVYAYEAKAIHDQIAGGMYNDVHALTLLSPQVFASGDGTSSAIVIWQLVLGEAHRRLSLPVRSVNTLTTLDSEKLVSGNWYNEVDCFDTSSGKKISNLRVSNCVWSLAKLSMQQVAVGTGERKINLWDIRTSYPHKIWSVFSGDGHDVRSLLTLDETRLLSVSYDNIARFWDLRNYQNLGSFQAYGGGWGNTLALLPNDQIAYTTTDRNLGIFNSRTQKIERAITCDSSINAVATLNNGLIMTGGQDQKEYQKHRYSGIMLFS